MLTAIRDGDQHKVIARCSEKHEAPFSCPECKREVILHKGNIRVHHFVHKPPITCRRGIGETEAHLKAKSAIFDALSMANNVKKLELEYNFGISIADVFAYISGVPVAIEIQRSKLSVEEITRRTSNYHGLGVNVLWLALSNQDIFAEKYSPSAWEKWVHAAYFGRVYYWLHGETIQPIHYGKFIIDVEPASWYDYDGEERFAGGYSRISKRYKTPQAGQRVKISCEFQAKYKKSWFSDAVKIPDCRLYMDRQEKWWN